MSVVRETFEILKVLKECCCTTSKSPDKTPHPTSTTNSTTDLITKEKEKETEIKIPVKNNSLFISIGNCENMPTIVITPHNTPPPTPRPHEFTNTHTPTT
jgi:hypothetical protein